MKVRLIELETPRLLMRQWRSADRDGFAQLNADPQVMKYYPAVLERAESDALADRLEGLLNERGWGFWALETKEEGRFIGYTGLHIPSTELPFSPCVEVGWRLAASAWGKGYATEAARASVKTGFQQLQLAEIVSFTTLANLRSQAVMKRLGMQREAGTFEHPRLPAGSQLRQHCLYRLTKAQWISDRRNQEGETVSK